METVLTIGEISRRSGVASSALRFYEERGLITSERAGSGGCEPRMAVMSAAWFVEFRHCHCYSAAFIVDGSDCRWPVCRLR